MGTLEDSIQIKATPEKVFKWLVHIEENCRVWHPDHIDLRWIKGKPFEEGSTLYFEEYLHGKLHKGKFLCSRVEPDRKIEYRPLFPMSIICPKGSFIIKPKGECCIFTATTYLRVGPLFSRLAKNNIEAIRKHIKEEGENLKRLLERG